MTRIEDDQPLPDNPLGLTRDQLLESLMGQFADSFNLPVPEPAPPVSWQDIVNLYGVADASPWR